MMRATASHPASPPVVPSTSDSLNFPYLVILTVVVGCINGYWHRATVVVDRVGLLEASYLTFEVSLIVWCAIWVLVGLLRSSDPYTASRRDILTILLSFICFLFPISAASWLGLLITALNLLVWHSAQDAMRRSGWLLLALCISGYFARAIASYFMSYILTIDAQLVAFLTQTTAINNTIIAADRKTTLIVLEACSSFNNVSLAFLGWMTARCYFGTRGIFRSIYFIIMSAAAVIFINTVRIGAIALFPNLYDLAHGSIGESIANLLSSLAIGLFAWKGAQK